jgi:hypothetical protein
METWQRFEKENPCPRQQPPTQLLVKVPGAVLNAGVINHSSVHVLDISSDIPDFIEVDLDAGLLKTTAASHENRQTPILHVTREDGLIVLQGLEMGRAYSFNIDEATGVLTASAVRSGAFSGAFGVCTP